MERSLFYDGTFELEHTFFWVSVGKLVEALVILITTLVAVIMIGVTSDPSGQEHVLLHESHPLCMECAKIGIFEDACEVRFGGLLQSDESLGLEPEIMVDVVADGSHESLEGCSRKHEVGGLLVLFDLTKSDSSWSVPPLLLEATFSGSSFFLERRLFLGLDLGSCGLDLYLFGELHKLGIQFLGTSFLVFDFLRNLLLFGHVRVFMKFCKI